MEGSNALVGLNLSDTYRVIRQIAEGGMGAIYEATHLRLQGKRYAIKVLTSKYARDQDVLARFRREAEITSKLGHEHIIEVHDFNVADGMAYLVMELLDGEDLAARIHRRGMLAVDVVVRIVEQIGSALEAAHRARIVHRDLKPQNIFLCRRDGRDDYVKVLDFGVSKVLDSSLALTQQDALLGTPYYMAPEQAEGRIDEIDGRTDVFAFAAIAWEMLTGKRAFAGATLAATLYNVCLVDPPDVHLRRPDVPPAASQVLRRALAKQRAVRTGSASDFARELIAALRAAPSPQVVPAAGFARTEIAGGRRGVSVVASTVASQPGEAIVQAPVLWTDGGGSALPGPWSATGASAAGYTAEPDRGLGSMAAGSVVAGPRRRRGALIAGVAAGVAAAAACGWLVLGPSMEARPTPAAAPVVLPTSATTATPPVSQPASSPREDDVALQFVVQPANADVVVQLDGVPLIAMQVRRPRSPSLVVTASGPGYADFRKEIVADKDQIITVTMEPLPAAQRRGSAKHAAVTPPRSPSRAAKSALPSAGSIAASSEPAAPPPRSAPPASPPEAAALPKSAPVAGPPQAAAAQPPGPGSAQPGSPQSKPAPMGPNPAAGSAAPPPAVQPPPKPPAKKTGTVFDQD